MVEKKAREPAELIWEGDSLEVARTFPKEIRKELGEDIERVRYGVKPKNGRAMKSIGAGVFELRQQDSDGWYRTVYLNVTDRKLHVLHAFKKQSAKTSKNDLSVAENRLKEVRARLLEEKKNARKK